MRDSSDSRWRNCPSATRSSGTAARTWTVDPSRRTTSTSSSAWARAYWGCSTDAHPKWLKARMSVPKVLRNPGPPCLCVTDDPSFRRDGHALAGGTKTPGRGTHLLAGDDPAGRPAAHHAVVGGVGCPQVEGRLSHRCERAHPAAGPRDQGGRVTQRSRAYHDHSSNGASRRRQSAGHGRREVSAGPAFTVPSIWLQAEPREQRRAAAGR